MDPATLRRDLLAWYDAQRRDMPWRDHPDPYAVFVSEAMLQQTRVETVRRYFDAWMARFPDWDTLAAASEDDVMAAWSGLGYYRRARNLHAAARIVARDGLPRDVEGLRSLPGVGPYMAGALASIAFGEPVPAIDGNVVRVLARLTDHDAPVDKAAGRRPVEDLAARLVPDDRPGDWNQAVMDLGATVCTPRGPACSDCPVRSHCAGRHRAEALPVQGAKRVPRNEAVHLALVMDERPDGVSVLAVPRPQDGLLAGTWILPGGEGIDAAELAREVQRQTGIVVDEAGPAVPVRHVFTHRIWDMHIHPMRRVGGQAKAPARWVPLDALDEVGFSTAARKAIASTQVEQAVP